MTNEEISKLSDDELRINLIKRIIPNQQDEWYESFIRAGYGDYLNNWNDLMPLVVEHKICLIRTNEYGDKWCADPNMDDFDSVRVVLKDAKRALAECLLQVLIAKGE